MTTSIETRIHGLEAGLRQLQRMGEEHYEELTNEFSNRSESQLNLLKYLFKQHRILKELVKSLVTELKIGEGRMKVLWTQAREIADSTSIQDELIEEYQKELGKDNV